MIAALSTPYRINGQNPAAAAAAGYREKMLGIDPANLLLLYPFDESAGTAIVNAQGETARNGVYSGVDLANAWGPKGEIMVPYWDGANDYARFNTANLDAATDLKRVSYGFWVKMFDDAYWGDSTQATFLMIRNNSNNNQIIQNDTSGQCSWRSRIAGGLEIRNLDASGFTGWVHLGITSDDADGAGEVKMYLNGAQTGSTQTTSNTMSDLTLETDKVIIGAQNWSGTSVLNGWMAWFGMWGSILGADAFATMYDGGPTP